MRPEVIALVALGPLPDEQADEERIEMHAELIEKIQPPVTDAEACALVQVFGPDDCYGLAWSVLHLIEKAPGWPLEECLKNEDNEWIQLLRQRVENKLRYDMSVENSEGLV